MAIAQISKKRDGKRSSDKNQEVVAEFTVRVDTKVILNLNERQKIILRFLSNRYWVLIRKKRCRIGDIKLV